MESVSSLASRPVPQSTVAVSDDIDSHRDHPSQAGPVQSLDERQECRRCGLLTYNVVDGAPQCLFHHGDTAA